MGAPKLNSDYVQIKIEILKKFTGELPFDIFVQRKEGKYTKLFNETDLLDFDRVDTYKSKGVSHFSVTRDDYAKYKVLVAQIGFENVGQTKQLSVNDCKRIVGDVIKSSAFEIMVEHNLNENSINHAAAAVSGCVKVLESDPKAIVNIISKLTQKPHVLKHSVLVSVFAILLARKVDIESEQSLNNIGLGAFLHDIGLTQLPIDPYEVLDMSAEEFKEIKTHPELGKRALERYRCIKGEVLSIVLQHHEQPNGGGFPNSMRGAEIFYPAKIVCIADHFVSLISKRGEHEAISAIEAIELMKLDVGKYDKKLLQSFVEIIIQGG